MKISLDKDSLQQYAQDHVEKLVLGVFVLVFLYLVYSSLGRERYETALGGSERTAEALIKRTQEAKNFMEDIGETRKAAETKILETIFQWSSFTDASKQMLVDVAWESYEWPTDLELPICPPLPLRRNPSLIAANNFRVASGRDAFRIKSAEVADRVGRAPPIDFGVRGQRWAMVTGQIPFEEQATIFQKTFAGTKFEDSSTDTEPEYVGYYIERAVLNHPSEVNDPTKLKWELPPFVKTESPPANSFQCTTAVQAYFDEMLPEEVDPNYIIETMVMPLPPRIVETIGPIATPDSNSSAWGEVATAPEIPLQANSQPGTGPTTAPRPATEDRSPFGTPMGTGFPGETTLDPTAVEEIPKVRLLRFFDYTLTPGKYYVYRFQLVVSNPNYGLNLEYLVSKDLATIRYLTSPWSAPTKPVTVQYDSRILVSTSTAPLRATDEPKVTFKVSKWFVDTGTEESIEVPSLRRGSLINKKIADTDEKPGRLFDTNSIVLDIRGGTSLSQRSRTMKEPGRVLVLDHNGRLVVRSELDDQAEYSLMGVDPGEVVPGDPNGMLGLPGGSGEGNMGLPDLEM